MFKHIVSIVVLLLIAMHVRSQHTMGLFQNDELSFNGYTLFSPGGANTTYLIDNCGREVHRWEADLLPGSVTYLLENGNLLRTLRLGNSTTFFGGGIGGRIEEVTWEGEVVWQYDYADENVQHHHDIAYMPNGHVLILAWEAKSAAEAIANGRNPDLLEDQLWPEHVVEVAPDGLNGGTIVWEWHFWDHLIQDFDASKANFGVVADHPELLDINYTSLGNSTSEDWQHCNAIAYNAERDEIVISSRNFHEFYVIDHSTTTEEAAGHTGGNSGRGGDILYRWGNPEVYQRGELTDRRCFGQHDVHWVAPGLEGAGKIMFYNNGIGRPGGSHSTIDIIEPPLDNEGKYFIEDGAAFGPTDLSWTYGSAPEESFFSSNISGAQRLPNGNTLICEGALGHFFEVDLDGEMHWDYINPVGIAGPLTQGEMPVFTAVFRTYRYGPDYPAFDGRDLTPGELIELEPLPSDCMITTSVVDPEIEDIKVYPNPFNNYFVIESKTSLNGIVKLRDMLGQSVFNDFIQGNKIEIIVDKLTPGIYILELPDGKTIKLICYPYP